MPGNYGLNGNDWYNQRLNQIASMMSMQNTDPSFLAGALIGDILRTPFQNWIDNKVLPTLTGGGNSNNGSSNSNDTQFQQVNGTYQAEPTANNPATTGNRGTDTAISVYSPNNGVGTGINSGMPYTRDELLSSNNLGYNDMYSAAQALNQDMDFTRLGQAQQKPPTQAEINEANNNTTNQAVTQEAQRQGNMQGIMSGLDNVAANNAAANYFGINSNNPFRQASSLGSGGEASYDEAMQNALLREIYKAKQDYAVAQQNNDTEGMQRANDAANLVRQMAREYGVDVSAGGSDVTIDSLANTMMREQERQQQEANQREAERLRNLTPQELLNNPEINISPNAFYQRAYQELNSRGIPEYRARQRAADMAMQYEANYMTAMQNEFNTQGVDSNTGAVNAAGVDTIMRMAAANNPEIAQMLASQYASPRDTWGFARDVDKAKLNEELREQLGLYNYQNIDVPKMRYNADLTKELNTNNAALQLRSQLALIDARAQAQGLGTMAVLQAKRDFIAGEVQAGHISPEVGAMALMGLVGAGNGSSNRNNGYSLTPKEQVQLTGEINYLVNNAVIGSGNADVDEAKKAVDNYMAEKEKYRAQLVAAGETDTMQYLDEVGSVVNFRYAALHGDETHALEIFKSFKDDPQLRALCGGIDLTRYDRMLENETKRQQQKNKEQQDKQAAYDSGTFNRANNISANTPNYGDANYWNVDYYLNR